MSNVFGQSSTNSLFRSQQLYGQNNNVNNNPFGLKPFGATSTIGAQNGGSLFVRNSTGISAGTQASSPTSFSAFSTRARATGASATRAFGAPVMPAIGASSSACSGSSSFCQKPAFGGFGSTPTQSASFGFQVSQPVFGSSVFESPTIFAAHNQPAFFASSTPVSGASSTPTFGASSFPAFGASNTPTLGSAARPGFGASSSSIFGASTTPAFDASSARAVGASSTPTFGTSNTFGSAASPGFGTSNPSIYGASTTPAFGASSAPAFGISTTPAFCGFKAPAVGASTAPSFSFGSSPSLGKSNSAFGSSPFGAAHSAFASQSSPFVGASTAPSFSFGSGPSLGKSNSAFGSSPFGAAHSAFASRSSPFGPQATTPTLGNSNFGQHAFGSWSGGSRVASYTATTETDVAAGAQVGKLESISAMPVYKYKSHEELRWEDYQLGSKLESIWAMPVHKDKSHAELRREDYQLGDKGAQATTTTPKFINSNFGQKAYGSQHGGSRVASYAATTETCDAAGAQAGKLESISAMPIYKYKSLEELRWEDYQLGDKGGSFSAGQAQTAGAVGFGTLSTAANPLAASNPFTGPSSTNPVAAKTQPFGTPGFGTLTSTTFNSSSFSASSTTNAVGAASSSTPYPFGASKPAFGESSSPSTFGASSTSVFGFSRPLFGSVSAQASSSTVLGAGFGNTQCSPPFFQFNAPQFSQTSAFWQTNSAFGLSSSPFGQTSLFNSTSSGSGSSLFSGTPSLTSNPMGFGQTNSSFSTPSRSAQPIQSTSFRLSQMGQALIGLRGTLNLFGQSASGQPVVQSSTVPQPAPVTNPFGILPAMPQMPIGQTRESPSPSSQYGNISLPVINKPPPVNFSSLVTPWHLLQCQLSLPGRKYHPYNEGPKLPFFKIDDETPKADAVNNTGENPMPIVTQPMEHRSSRTHSEKVSPLKGKDTSGHNGGKVADEDLSNGHAAEANGGGDPIKSDPKTDGVHNDNLTVEALLPKLRSPDYYTEPLLRELANKERTEPGYCSHVENFVVGRNGYGRIKFLGETDVRGLDLEALVRFNDREVIVYMDDRQKPPVGQGLNKPAEITLLNVKCIDKKTGQCFIDGPNVKKYKGILKKKGAEQGAKFVSYNPVDGEWIFRVSHFST